ncbi:MAG: hypothetical protein MZU84_06345 [Sphingobacterium sp.]|nr:hypothetical protein [Sphingobacterium sp.]
MSAWKPSQAQETVWPGLRPRRPVYLTPYVLDGLRPHLRARRRRDRLRPRARSPKLELGLGLQVRPDRQPDLRRDRQSGFRPGRGRRRPGQPDPLLAVLPGEAPVLPGAIEQLRLQHGRHEHPLLQPPASASSATSRRLRRPHLRRRAPGRTPGRRGTSASSTCRRPPSTRRTLPRTSASCASAARSSIPIPTSAASSPAGSAPTAAMASTTASTGSGASAATTTSPSNGPRPSRTGRTNRAFDLDSARFTLM